VIAQSVYRLGYGLDDRGPRVQFPAGGWEFFSSPPRPKRPGREADHSHPSTAEVKECVKL
jgi:hypothetical protein